MKRVELISYRRDSHSPSVLCSQRLSASIAFLACATAFSKTRYYIRLDIVIVVLVENVKQLDVYCFLSFWLTPS